MSVAVIILTYDEELHIARALKSIGSFAAEVFIVDSFSKDRTVEIARALGATVVQRAWKNHADQFQWALDTIETRCDWIMRLDADEIIQPDLAAVIAADLPHLGSDVVGVSLDRKHIFMDRWIRHGDRYPVTLTRLFRRGHGRVEQRWMDEHVVVNGGRTVHLRGGFADHNLKDLTAFTSKHNDYATREAVEVLNQRYALFSEDALGPPFTAPPQAASKRRIKERIYNRLPFWVGPLSYFLYRYFLRLGFLDGRAGLIYHFLQGFWYRFLVGAKVVELDRSLVQLRTNAERRVALKHLTGLDVTDG